MSRPGVRILGIDPGSRCCGFGVVDVDGADVRHVAHGVLRVGRGAASIERRLAGLHDGMTRTIRDQRPDEIAVETPFVGRNVAAALRIGEARGVILLAASQADVPVREYAPAAVKRSVVGNGAASKPQVGRLVQAWLRLDAPPSTSDAADALALALCHARRRETAARLEPTAPRVSRDAEEVPA